MKFHVLDVLVEERRADLLAEARHARLVRTLGRAERAGRTRAMKRVLAALGRALIRVGTRLAEPDRA